jgi:pimeloyl-ACP methyl ester carboxylesterase
MPKFTVHAWNLHYEIAGDHPDTITLIHGLGARGQDFSKIKESGGLKDYRFLFIDLLGFGHSDKPEQFDYAMGSQAEIILRLFDGLGIRETVLIGHSMGGIIGQMIAERFPVTKFINCEGNLMIEDCKLSAEISAKGLAEFETAGFDELKELAAGTPFYDGYCQTTAYAMYHSARQLVESCRNGDLLERFAKLPLPKLYVYGERTQGRRKSEQLLMQYGVALKYIPDSGHNMITENPADFYRAAADFLMEHSQYNSIKNGIQ